MKDLPYWMPLNRPAPGVPLSDLACRPFKIVIWEHKLEVSATRPFRSFVETDPERIPHALEMLFPEGFPTGLKELPFRQSMRRWLLQYGFIPRGYVWLSPNSGLKIVDGPKCARFWDSQGQEVGMETNYKDALATAKVLIQMERDSKL